MTRHVTVTCDRCQIGPISLSSAIAWNWLMRGDRDICPKCIERRKCGNPIGRYQVPCPKPPDHAGMCGGSRG